MALPGLADDVAQGDDVHYEGEGAHYGHCGRVGVDAGAFDDAVEGAVSVEGREGCPFACRGAVRECHLEERVDLREHAPDGEGVGTVHNPAAAVPAEGCDGRGEKKSHTAVP